MADGYLHSKRCFNVVQSRSELQIQYLQRGRWSWRAASALIDQLETGGHGRKAEKQLDASVEPADLRGAVLRGMHFSFRCSSGGPAQREAATV